MPEMSADEVLAFIADPVRTAKLAFTRRDGQPSVLPVWIVVDDATGTILFNTGSGTAKAEAMRRDPRVAICVDDDRPPFSFATVEGTVELIDDLDEVRRWATVIGGRYMGPDRAEELGTRNGVPGELLVRLTPTRAIGFRAVAD